MDVITYCIHAWIKVKQTMLVKGGPGHSLKMLVKGQISSRADVVVVFHQLFSINFPVYLINTLWPSDTI